MKIEFITKNDARRQVAVTLHEFVKSNKDKIDAIFAREAKGMAKLEKGIDRDRSKEASAHRNAMSGGAVGRDKAVEDRKSFTVGAHHIGAIRNTNEILGHGSDIKNANDRLRGESDTDSFSPGASQTHGKLAYKSEPSMKKDALPDMNLAAPPTTPEGASAPQLCIGCGGGNTEPLGNHLGLDHFMCRDCGEVGTTMKEQNQQADQNQAQNALEAMAQKSLTPMGKGEDSDQAAWNRKQMVGGKKIQGTSTGMHPDRPANVVQSHGAALRGESDPNSFAPGASQSHGSMAYKSEMNKGAMPMGKSVASVRQAAGLMGGTTPKMPSVKAPTVPITSAAAPQKDAFNTGGMNPTTQAAMGKAEKDPSKKPFNTGEGHGGVPSKEVPNPDVALEAPREGAEPPPLEGGKEVSAPGSGGQIKKTKMSKGEMCQSAPAPLRKVADIRSQAAAKHAAKGQQVAQDVKAISAVSNAVQKAEGIPAAPKAPGAGATNAAPKLPAASASSAPASTPPKL